MVVNSVRVTAIVLFLSPMVSAAGPKAKVSLVSSVEAIVPGEPFEVGVRFELDDGWHIYWINSGDSGLPPRIDWKPPPHFTVGKLVFPVPKRHVSPGGIVTNILPGAPMLTGRVTTPESIEGDSVQLAAKVVYLVCSDKCLREEAQVSVDLPVLAPADTAPAANVKLFQRARRAAPNESSKHLSVSVEATPAGVSGGSKFDLTLAIDIKPGLHIQSNKPSLPSLIATDVFLEPVEGLEFGEAIYPQAHLREVPYLGKLSEFSGKIAVRIPGQLAADRGGEPIRVDGVLRYQACTDSGNCMPPAGVSFRWTGGVGAAAPRGQQFAGSDASSASGEVASDPPGAEAGAGGDDLARTGPADSGDRSAATGATSANGVELDAFLTRVGPVGLLLGCFLYGLFINATPCVLPLLSIKVLGFVQQAHESRRRTFLLGLSFGAGVLIFFVVLGLLAAQGKNVLHFPAAIIALGGVVMALALSMLGVFTLQVPTSATHLEARITREGWAGSFGKGALAPVLGFACTGPMLAGAWGWATQQPPKMAILAFLFAGFGMASPYMLLGANPKWLGFLPRPGNWMITFERLMGFLLLAMVIWLIHPLIAQVGSAGLEWTLAFYVTVALGCWLWGRVQVTMPAATRWRYRGAATALVALSGLVIYGWVFPVGPAVARTRAALLAGGGPAAAAAPAGRIAWQRWTPEAVEHAVKSGRLVLVDFTAAYCTVCKVNKKVALDTPEVAAKLKKAGAVTFQGDFTLGDPAVFEELQKHGRAGVPLNLIYPPGRASDPLVLRPQLTQTYLLEKLDEAIRIGERTVSAVGF